jgi:hypothetical protein
LIPGGFFISEERKPMSKPKLLLIANPEFSADVEIPIAGSGVSVVRFTFKHRTKKQYQDWIESLASMQDVDGVLSVATAWDLVEPLNRESVTQLIENHMGAPAAIFETYIRELMGNRLKN